MAAKKLLVIGGGTAGRICATRMAGAGWDVVVAEPGRIGGTCLWYGCMPKRSLAHSAWLMRTYRTGSTFGVPCPSVLPDWREVLRWKEWAQAEYAGDQEGILADAGARRVKARAHFVSAEEVRVGDEVFRPDAVLVATGSTSVLPDVPGIHLAQTSTEAMSFPQVPERLVIIGGGDIGMEFAGIYASFGSAVTVVQHSGRLLRRSDPEIVQVACAHLEALGVRFLMHRSLARVEGTRHSPVAVVADDSGAEERLPAERILVAVGRRPAIERLGLDEAGVVVERGRPVLGPGLRTTNPKVWVAGDATGGPMHVTHANLHGGLVAEDLLEGRTTSPGDVHIPTATFTVPELAQVGITAEEAEKAAIEYEVLTFRYQTLGAGIILDARDSLVKIVVAKGDQRILGAHIAAPDAADLIVTFALAIRMGARARDLAEVRGIHPSLGEGITWAAR